MRAARVQRSCGCGGIERGLQAMGALKAVILPLVGLHFQIQSDAV